MEKIPGGFFMSALMKGTELEILFRIVLACICGLLLGLERTKHQKAAGVRTYVIVALGAVIFTIISKYGFLDVLNNEGVGVDVSRVACNIVTGVGFLGAGTILIRRDRIQGLTTSAGIWVIAAIGMAIGAGMYVIGGIATVLVLLVQTICQSLFEKKFVTKIPGRISVSMIDKVSALESVTQLLEEKEIEIYNCNMKRNKEHLINYTFQVQMPEKVNTLELVNQISDISGVRTIEI